MAKHAGGGLPVGYQKSNDISRKSRGSSGGSVPSDAPKPKGNNGQHLGFNRAKPKGGAKGVNPSDFNQRSGKKK